MTLTTGTLNLAQAGSPTTTIRYEILGAYGTYGVVEANTDSSQGLNMRAYSGYAHASPPAAPTNCAGSYIASRNRITVTWTDNSSDEDNFRLEYKIGAGSWTFRTSPAANATSYIHSFVTTDVVYYYRIRSESSSGNSAWNESAGVSTGTPT